MSALPLAYDAVDSYLDVTDGYVDFSGFSDPGFAEISGDDFEIEAAWLQTAAKPATQPVVEPAEEPSRQPWVLFLTGLVIVLTAVGVMGSGFSALRALYAVNTGVDALFAGTGGAAILALCSFVTAVVVAVRMVVGLILGGATAIGAWHWMQRDDVSLLAQVVRLNLVHLAVFGFGWGLFDLVLRVALQGQLLTVVLGLPGLVFAALGICGWGVCARVLAAA